jgi:hypothetical protein
METVVVLPKSFISFVTKNKYFAVNPPSTSAENVGVSQKSKVERHQAQWPGCIWRRRVGFVVGFRLPV